MNTALILQPTRSTPKPVTTIHPQSAGIELYGVVIGEYTIRSYHGHFGTGAFIFDANDDISLRPDIKHHSQRSPEAGFAPRIADDSVARAYRLVRTLKAEDPRVQTVLSEIAFRLLIANPFADR